MPVKTDEKKQHFDDIYVQTTPVSFKTEILDRLEYVSDNFNRQMFDRLVLPWIKQQGKKINFIDLCACFGNTTMATACGMSYDEIRENWKDEDSCMTINKKRIFDCHITAIDISKEAMEYGKKAGLYDDIIVADLNDKSLKAEQKAVEIAMSNCDFMVATAALVYLDVDTIDRIIKAFMSKPTEGYMLVNFLNPFALEKSDQTKRKLLENLEFVGSMATRHRRMSKLEQENYPGEVWAILEIWVLKRRVVKRKASP